MIETVLAEGAYEQRFGIRLGGVRFGRYVRRPISTPPPEGTLAMVDNGTRGQTGTRTSAGFYRDGKFRRVPFEVTHWTVDD